MTTHKPKRKSRFRRIEQFAFEILLLVIGISIFGALIFFDLRDYTRVDFTFFFEDIIEVLVSFPMIVLYYTMPIIVLAALIFLLVVFLHSRSFRGRLAALAILIIAGVTYFFGYGFLAAAPLIHQYDTELLGSRRYTLVSLQEVGGHGHLLILYECAFHLFRCDQVYLDEHDWRGNARLESTPDRAYLIVMSGDQVLYTYAPDLFTP
jgi:hypothetical protein